MTKYRENPSTEGIEQIQAKQGKKKKNEKTQKQAVPNQSHESRASTFKSHNPLPN